MTGYSSGYLNHRIEIKNRKEQTVGKFGIDSGGIEYETVGTVWASVDWSRGSRALRQGSVDAYGVVIVKMRYNTLINPRSHIIYEGYEYKVLPETFHPEKQDNKIQFTAQLIIDR